MHSVPTLYFTFSRLAQSISEIFYAKFTFQLHKMKTHGVSKIERVHPLEEHEGAE